MVTNYTPLDVARFSAHLPSDKKDSFNTILLVLVTFTTLVLAVLLFILIQKKLKDGAAAFPAHLIAAVNTRHG